jgi:hypothetical protein
MTRRIVYGISLWVFLGAAACTLASVALPNWVTYTSPTEHEPIKVSYGLHKRCSSITGKCNTFPRDEDCVGANQYFCSMWRSTGFFMNFSLMVELACIVAYVTILFGGRQVRESGWRILAGLLSLVALGQLVAMSLVVGWHIHMRLGGMLTHDRHIYTTMIGDSSWAGSSTSRGCYVR